MIRSLVPSVKRWEIDWGAMRGAAVDGRTRLGTLGR